MSTQDILDNLQVLRSGIGALQLNEYKKQATNDLVDSPLHQVQ